MDNIKDVITKVIGDLSSQDIRGQDSIVSSWQKIIDSREISHVKITGMKNKKLYITVDTSSWMYHFRSKKHSIINRFKEEEQDVKDIIFRIGKIT